MTGGPPTAAAERPADTRRPRLDGLLQQVPFYALLLPAYPVLLLYADNVLDVTPAEVAGPLVAVIGLAAILLAVLAVLFRSWRRAALVVVTSLVSFLLAGLVVDELEGGWPDDFLLRLHALVVVGWMATTMLGVYVALKLGPRMGVVTQLLNVVSVALLVLATVPVIGDIRVPGDGPARSAAVQTAREDVALPTDQRDIYHLVFDRYGSERSLELGQGIDNSEFIAWLRGQGFQVIDDARANFERTALSLSSIHDMSLHQELAKGPQAGYDDLVERIRSSRAATTLKDLGYRYILAGSWWGPSAYSHLADTTIESEHVVSFGSALADRSLLPSLEAMAAFATSGSVDGSERQVADATEDQFRSLAALIDEPGPKLVFAHFLVPHDPYVFLEDGTVDGARATYETQLRYTNAQLKQLIERLLSDPTDAQPIIVLQADEGPYPERYDGERNEFDWGAASDEEVVTKFGVLDAFYLPGPEGDAALPAGLSLANTYPEILRRYHGLEVAPLEDRTYAMIGGDFLDLVDITERVGGAFERLWTSSSGPATHVNSD